MNTECLKSFGSKAGTFVIAAGMVLNNGVLPVSAAEVSKSIAEPVKIDSGVVQTHHYLEGIPDADYVDSMRSLTEINVAKVLNFDKVDSGYEITGSNISYVTTKWWKFEGNINNVKHTFYTKSSRVYTLCKTADLSEKQLKQFVSKSNNLIDLDKVNYIILIQNISETTLDGKDTGNGGTDSKYTATYLTDDDIDELNKNVGNGVSVNKKSSTAETADAESIVQLIEGHMIAHEKADVSSENETVSTSDKTNTDTTKTQSKTLASALALKTSLLANKVTGNDDSTDDDTKTADSDSKISDNTADSDEDTAEIEANSVSTLAKKLNLLINDTDTDKVKTENEAIANVTDDSNSKTDISSTVENDKEKTSDDPTLNLAPASDDKSDNNVTVNVDSGSNTDTNKDSSLQAKDQSASKTDASTNQDQNKSTDTSNNTNQQQSTDSNNASTASSDTADAQTDSVDTGVNVALRVALTGMAASLLGFAVLRVFRKRNDF